MAIMLAAIAAKAQKVTLNNWQVHTSMLSVQAGATDSRGRIWLGTSGGIAIFDNAAQDTILLNQRTGLLNSDIRVLKNIPDSDRIIAGAIDGMIEIISEDIAISHITSIRDHGFNNAAINDIAFTGDSACIAGAFGLAVFDISQMIFTNTVETIGTFPKNTPVNSILIDNDTIWVATSSGMASIPLSKPINVPSNWNTYIYRVYASAGDTVGKKMVYANAKIVKLSDTVYANLNTDILAFKNQEFQSVLHAGTVDWQSVIDIDVYGGRLAYSTPYTLNLLNGGTIFQAWGDSVSNGFQVLGTSPDADILYFYRMLGAQLIHSDYTSMTVTPNTPIVNLFLGIAVAPDGKVYGVPDNSENVERGSGGFMCYDGTSWTNYSRLFTPDMPDISTRFCSITAAPDNRIYVSSWGGGLLILDANSNAQEKYKVLNDSSSKLVGYVPGFTIAGSTIIDSKGSAWTVNYGENTNGTLLMTYDSNYTYTAFTNPYNQGNRYFFNMDMDNYGTKWICSTTGSDGGGILFFNDGNTPTNPSDDKWGRINTSTHPNLVNNAINCCAADNTLGDGMLWIGTSNGASLVYNIYSASTGASEKVRVNKVALLEGQNIHDIMIDAVGNKWFATSNGIWVLNQAGDSLIAQFAKSDSTLMNNAVYSLATNPDNGLIYIGTKDGLYIAQSSFLRPEKEYAISVYPQPFKIDRDAELTIDGLVASSDVRIITPDGMLIKHLESNSKRTTWDGKDDKGNRVAPGVYIVIGNSSATKSSAAGKIAVIE